MVPVESMNENIELLKMQEAIEQVASNIDHILERASEELTEDQARLYAPIVQFMRDMKVQLQNMVVKFYVADQAEGVTILTNKNIAMQEYVNMQSGRLGIAELKAMRNIDSTLSPKDEEFSAPVHPYGNDCKHFHEAVAAAVSDGRLDGLKTADLLGGAESIEDLMKRIDLLNENLDAYLGSG